MPDKALLAETPLASSWNTVIAAINFTGEDNVRWMETTERLVITVDTVNYSGGEKRGASQTEVEAADPYVRRFHTASTNVKVTHWSDGGKVIERWKHHWDEHLNGAESIGMEFRSCGGNGYVRMVDNSNQSAPTLSDV